jgi:hypothetical protein
VNAATAKALIAAKGQAMTLAYHGASAYDPSTATVTLTDTQVTTVGVVLPLSRGLKNMPGSTIGIDDQQLLLPGDIAQPAIDTTVTVGSKNYVITQVSPLAPDGTALIYDCIVRGQP